MAEHKLYDHLSARLISRNKTRAPQNTESRFQKNGCRSWLSSKTKQLKETFVTILLSVTLRFYRMIRIANSCFQAIKRREQQMKFNSMNALSFPHFPFGLTFSSISVFVLF